MANGRLRRALTDVAHRAHVEHMASLTRGQRKFWATLLREGRRPKLVNVGPNSDNKKAAGNADGVNP